MNIILRPVHITRFLPNYRISLNDCIRRNLSKKVICSERYSYLFQKKMTHIDTYNVRLKFDDIIHNEIYTNCINSNICFWKIKNNFNIKIAVILFCSSIVYLLKNIFEFDGAILPSVHARDTPPEKPTNRSTANFIADAIEDVLPGVVHIGSVGRYQNTGSNGSGFIIDESGMILTNAHVVRNQSQIEVHLHDGSVQIGTVHSLDPISDLAIVKINKSGLPCLKLGESSSLRAGEWVIALGSPLSLSKTVTAGIVSRTGRKCVELGIHNKNIDYIQTDALITFGHSGGPLINLDGEVIGINTLTLTTGISFAIPIDYVKLFIGKAKQARVDHDRRVNKPSTESCQKSRYIGVSVLTLTPDLIDEINAIHEIALPENLKQGVLVTQVMPGSPAHKAGLRRGDIIVTVDRNLARSCLDLFQAIERLSAVEMTLVRENDTVVIRVFPENS